MEMIPYSNLKWDPGILELYSRFKSPGFQFSNKKTFPDPGFHKQKFSGLRNPDSLTKGEREDSSKKVLKRFFGTQDFPYLKLGIRNLKVKSGRVLGLKVCLGTGMPKRPSRLRDCTKL